MSSLAAHPTLHGRQGGFTLIEVLIAIVLLAFVSVISWRALDSVMRASGRLDESAEEIRTISRVVQQFELDVAQRATTQIPIAPSQSGAPADVAGDGLPPAKGRLLPDALTTRRHGQIPFLIEVVRAAPDNPGLLQRVYWWLERGTLYRSAGPASDRFPLAAPQAGQAVAVLTDVEDFAVRAWRPGRGWTRLPAAGESTRATGLELVLAQRTARGKANYRRVIPLL